MLTFCTANTPKWLILLINLICTRDVNLCKLRATCPVQHGDGEMVILSMISRF